MPGLLLFFVLSAFFPVPVLGAGVIINEIAWMGTVPKAGESAQAAANNEWLELFNSSPAPVSLDGWKITAGDGMPDIHLSGVITAGSYFLLERGNDDVVSEIAADLIYPFKNNAFSNDGERLFLKDNSSAIIDEVNSSSGWLTGDNATKQTMQLVESSWVTATSTPRVINFGANQNVSKSVEVQITNPASFSSGISAASIPTIKAYAGEDKIAIAGAEVEFFGQAIGTAGEPLDNARFWWNFGDGGDKEGRAVSHIFQIPGDYTVGLHISSGLFAGSDYALIKVIPNQISIAGVLLGESGYVSLKNKSDYLLDIGGWAFEDSGGKRFFIPAKTKIRAGAEISFSNSTTGILKNTSDSNILLFYPNGAIALKWEKQPLAEKVKTTPEISVEKIEMSGQVKYEIPENQQKNHEQKVQTMAQISVPILFNGKLFLFFALMLSLAAGAGFLILKKNIF